MRAGVGRALALLSALCAGACSYTTNTATPAQGNLTVGTPFTTPPAPVTGGAAPFQRTPGLPPSGTYEGVGRVLTNPEARCQQTIPIRNFVVNGNMVRYGQFRGTIQPDGGLQMQLRAQRIIGGFMGDRFEAHFWAPHPRCTYAVQLQLATPAT